MQKTFLETDVSENFMFMEMVQLLRETINDDGGPMNSRTKKKLHSCSRKKNNGQKLSSYHPRALKPRNLN